MRDHLLPLAVIHGLVTVKYTRSRNGIRFVVTSYEYPLFKPCLFHSPPSLTSACLATVHSSTKGLPLQLAMALCNAPRDASAFSAQPRLYSGFVILEGFSSLASQGHARMHILRLFAGLEQARIARAPPARRVLLAGCRTGSHWTRTSSHGCRFRVLAFV
jgi:hypothetical protein